LRGCKINKNKITSVDLECWGCATAPSEDSVAPPLVNSNGEIEFQIPKVNKSAKLLAVQCLSQYQYKENVYELCKMNICWEW
jgi:hypothetical protein